MRKTLKNSKKFRFPENIVIETVVIAPLIGFFGRTSYGPFLVKSILPGDKITEMDVEHAMNELRIKLNSGSNDLSKAFIILNTPLNQVESLADNKDWKRLRQIAHRIYRPSY